MSHTKKSGGIRQDLYVRFFEYARAVTRVVITDEGVYLKDEVPADYGGAQLELDSVDAIFMVNLRFELQIMEFENPLPMDKLRKTGGRITRDGVTVRAAVGPSTTDTPQVMVMNATLDQERQTVGAAALAEFRQYVGTISGQVPS